MERCPLCRAALNGADTCRRCRAELATVKRVAAEARALGDLALHRLSLGDTEAANRLLRRALVCHATTEIRDLLRVTASLLAEASSSGAAPLADD